MYDAIIVGGGISGCACAYMCAKLGVKTLLVEKKSYLGGLATGGLVVPVMKSDCKNLNIEFYNDLIAACEKFGANVVYGDGNQGWFNPQLLKIVLEDMLVNAGCKILLEAEVNFVQKNDLLNFEGTILTKTLSLPFVSKYIVDGTGDGNICEILNCEFWQDFEKKQPNSLRFLLSNVDIKKFCNFLNKIDKNEEVTNFFEINNELHFTTAYTFDENTKWALVPYFKEAVENGLLDYADTDYFQIFSVAGMKNTVAFNCPRLKEVEDNEFSYTNSIIEGRRAIFRLANFCKKTFPGFSNSFISNIAEMVGTREFRRAKCEYDFTVDDILNPKNFENTVLYSDYPIDIHSNEKNNSTLKHVVTYQFPLESLMVKGCTGLFVIGRCLGADFKAQASLRVQKSCMSMGEGVSRYIAKCVNK